MNNIKATLERNAADLLSLLRALCGCAAVVAGIFYQNYPAAFILAVLGWSTDPFDGLAARKWGSLRDRYPDFDADGLADTVIAFGVTLLPISYAVQHHASSDVIISLISLYILTAVSGGAMVMIMMMKHPLTQNEKNVISFNMVVMHGGVQIGLATIWLAYVAYGIPIAVVTFLVLIAVAVSQKRKIQLWIDGRLK